MTDARMLPPPPKPSTESWWATPEMQTNRELFFTKVREKQATLQASEEGRKFPREWRDA